MVSTNVTFFRIAYFAFAFNLQFDFNYSFILIGFDRFKFY